METPLLGWSRLPVNSVVFPHELVINRQLLLLLRHSQAVCPTSSQQPFMFCICICVYIVFVFVYLCGWKYVEMFCGGDIKWMWNSECSHCFTETSPPLPSEIWKPWAPPCPVKPFWLNVKNCPKMMIHSAAKGHRNFLCPYFKWLWVCSAINSYQSVCLAKCAMLYFLQKYIIIWNAKLLQTGTVSINKESSPSHARSTLVYLGLPWSTYARSIFFYLGLHINWSSCARKKRVFPA